MEVNGRLFTLALGWCGCTSIIGRFQGEAWDRLGFFLNGDYVRFFICEESEDRFMYEKLEVCAMHNC